MLAHCTLLLLLVEMDYKTSTDSISEMLNYLVLKAMDIKGACSCSRVTSKKSVF